MERDCLVIPFGESELILACDSLGGIGPKEGDSLFVPLEISAQFTARVALAEVLSAHGEPLLISVTLSTEPYPWLEEAKKGVLKELQSIGKENIPLLFSSEKNIRTYATGLGITVLGRRPREKKLPAPQEGMLYALGVPSCGASVLKNLNYLADLRDICQLQEILPDVPILPVGSRGIFCEALNFIRGTSLTLVLNPKPPFPLYTSCGPATALLFASPKDIAQIAKYFSKPLWVVGELRAQEQRKP
ncbi:MAG: hypothetical protein ABDK87_07005 [Atribacterota bacterium]